MNVRVRKAKEGLKKAQRQHQKEVKEARRQLEIVSKASSTRPRKRQKTQKKPKEPDVVMIQPELEIALNQPKSRCGRTIRKPAHYSEN
jgi:hypothetical protein